MTIAPSPCLFRVLTAPGDIRLEYDVGAGPVQFTHTLASGVVSGSGAIDDILAALAADIAAQDPALAGTTATLGAQSWRVAIDVGAGNTLRVIGSSPATTADLHLLGFDQGADTVAAQVTTAPEAPLGTWASPVPLGADGRRKRVAVSAQAVAVNGQAVTVRRGVHLSTAFEFTDVAEALVYHSGAKLAAAAHDADAWERAFESLSDGAAWQYSTDRTVRLNDGGVWVLDAATDFNPSQRIDGWPFYGFRIQAREFVQ